MFIDLNEIEEGDELRLDETLPLPDLELPTGERIPLADVRLAGEVLRGERGVELEAALAARVRLACSRCLEPYDSQLATTFFLTLVADGAEFASDDARLEDQDATLFYAEEGRADLGTIATEQITLNLPLKPLCSPGCKGLCPACGSNRNELECACQQEAVDPRFAPLLELKKRFGGC